MAALSAAVSRQIERIIILALHGKSHEVKTIDDAITFIETYKNDGLSKPIERYEIELRYNNGNLISGSFKDKESAIDFLRSYRPLSRSTP